VNTRPLPSWHPLAERVQDMTLRDYFAAKAMHHWLSLPIDAHQRQKLSAEAYKIADAMLEVRNAAQ
jgi:hypothetical protein